MKNTNHTPTNDHDGHLEALSASGMSPPNDLKATMLAMHDPDYEPPAEDRLSAEALERKISDATRRYHRTDMGNASRLVDQHGDSIRFRYEARGGRWHAWDGRRWAEDRTGQVERYAKASVGSILKEAAKLEGDDRTALATWGIQSQAAARIDAMVKLARSDERIVITLDDLDANPWALNTTTGIVDLHTGELRPHDPSELHSKITTAGLREDATSVRWETFLEQVLPDAEVRRYVQKLAGYSIAGHVGENVLPFPYGSGANGKSVFLSVIRDVLGDYATEAAPDLLVARRERGIPADVADLRGFRFVTTTEVEGGRAMATDVMKRLTGEPRLKARRLHQNFEEFDNVTTLWMAANDRPEVDGLDEAIWRRIRIIPFTVTIPESQRDPDLVAKLREERDGILGWLVDGIVAYRDEGLESPKAVRAATDDYRADSNPLADWFDSECERDDDAVVATSELRKSYEDYCRRRNVRDVVGQRSPRWAEGLERLGCFQQGDGRKSINGRQVRAWCGVRLVGRTDDANGGIDF